MKVKIDELTGAALDWAVAKCEGIELLPAESGQQYVYSAAFGNCFNPSGLDWNVSGPIIERERIDLDPGLARDDGWYSTIFSAGHTVVSHGPTALVAAMRCYVAWKVGGEVDVPAELVST